GILALWHGRALYGGCRAFAFLSTAQLSWLRHPQRQRADQIYRKSLRRWTDRGCAAAASRYCGYSRAARGQAGEYPVMGLAGSPERGRLRRETRDRGGRGAG